MNSQFESLLSRLLTAKARSQLSVSVCIPAHNEEASIGRICDIIDRRLVRTGLVDELLVLDDRSSDNTTQQAELAGARVANVTNVLPWISSGQGKGEVLWKSLWASHGDLVIWVDGDIVNFGSHFVTRLLDPLLTDPKFVFAKGHYNRPVEGDPTGGGRTTELAARPLISRFFPHLSRFPQPLSGEFGGRRDVLEAIPFVQGWGVDLGVLIDVANLAGADRMAAVDLGTRIHRNRPLSELGPQAMAVQSIALRRAGVIPSVLPSSVHASKPPSAETLYRPLPGDGGMEEIAIPVAERAPMCDMPGYFDRHEWELAPFQRAM
jgi:glucosyl-3-phosphoglycerate synthase